MAVTPPSGSQPARYFGLDWLRIAAFGLLILYHIGMLFVSWDFHVKSEFPVIALEEPMMFLNPWRLALLFFISGVASRLLWAKTRGAGFLRQRSARLLLPLAAGLALWVAPQPWAQIAERAGYPHGFGTFWVTEYFTFQNIAGADMPTWNHLWFIAYLWMFTAALVGAAALLPPAARARAQQAFNAVLSGPWLLLIPVAALAAIRLALFSRFGETHGLVDDPFGLLFYGLTFVLGFGAARAPALLAFAGRHWRLLLLGSLAGYAVRLWFNSTYGDLDPLPPGPHVVAQIGRATQIWLTILGLVGVAIRHLQFDSPVRRYLSEAIFPFYIAHQTIIIVVSHAQRPFNLGAPAEIAILVTATVAGCLLFHELGRRSGPLRLFFGLSPTTRAALPARAQVQ